MNKGRSVGNVSSVLIWLVGLFERRLNPFVFRTPQRFTTDIIINLHAVTSATEAACNSVSASTQHVCLTSIEQSLDKYSPSKSQRMGCKSKPTTFCIVRQFGSDAYATLENCNLDVFDRLRFDLYAVTALRLTKTDDSIHSISLFSPLTDEQQKRDNF